MSHLLIRGDSRTIPLADRSVHCVICSPPYFGLRDYGTAAWDGGDAGCDHVAPPGKSCGQRADRTFTLGEIYRDACGRCGARRVDRQIGLESSIDDYVATMVRVFGEVKRVLRDDGCLWLNMGDGYASHPAGNTTSRAERGDGRGLFRQGGGAQDHYFDNGKKLRATEDLPGLKPKDLIGMPWRLALALQADGWYLRSDIIWSKPNPMPESVTDRPTKSHEYVFLLSKREHYYYDAEAVREGHSRDWSGQSGIGSSPKRWKPMEDDPNWRNGHSQWERTDSPSPNPAGRNLRSVWTVPTESFPGAHFATFPRKLISPCIRAGTSERGCCPKCGAPWERVVERENQPSAYDDVKYTNRIWHRTKRNLGARYQAQLNANPPITIAWRPGCDHDLPPAPCVVFDPFIGSGTVIVVAEALGRRGVGVDLSHEYLMMARRRIERPHAAVPRPGREEYHPLFDGGDA
ncbi:unnamed protein product [uncultured bacterium]|nr:unnamed protein product [uncultured bacterium]